MATTFDEKYRQISQRTTDALRKAFGPNVTIQTDEGWHGRIHVKIVASALNGLSEDEKQIRIWETLRQELSEEAQEVSLVLAYGMDEI